MQQLTHNQPTCYGESKNPEGMRWGNLTSTMPSYVSIGSESILPVAMPIESCLPTACLTAG